MLDNGFGQSLRFMFDLPPRARQGGFQLFFRRLLDGPDFFQGLVHQSFGFFPAFFLQRLTGTLGRGAQLILLCFRLIRKGVDFFLEQVDILPQGQKMDLPVRHVAPYRPKHDAVDQEEKDQEKDQLGEQLIRAGRLAEIGEMSAGFAHEINNPLQIIKSEYTLVEMILADMKERGDIKQSEDLAELEDSIDQIKLQVDRCADITQAILQFGRKEEPVTKDIALRTFIPEVVGMMAHKAGVHGIVIKQEISGQNSDVHGDLRHLQQVLVNLLNNAIDAVIATTWNVSPKDDKDNPGPIEQALIGTKVRDENNPFELVRIARSFDPCLACSIHVITPKGRDLGRFRVA